MRLRVWTASAGLLACVAAAALHGCNSTAGGLIPFMPVEVGGVARDGGGPLFFQTGYFRPQSCGYSEVGYACGWTVELDQAVIAVGPFYFYTAPPSTQNAQTGSVIVQVTAQQFVNVVDPTLYTLDGGANGESGPSDSVDVFLLPPGCTYGQPSNTNGGVTCSATDLSPLATYQKLFEIPNPDPADPDGGAAGLELLQLQTLASGSTAFVAGKATEMLEVMLDGGFDADGHQLDGGLVDAGLLTVPFYGFITIDQSTGGNGADQAAATVLSLEQVAGASPCADGGETAGCSCTDAAGDGGSGDGGIECSIGFTTQPSVLQIRVDPTHWFDGVDFSLLTQSQYAGTSWLPDAGGGYPGPADPSAPAPLTWNLLDGRPSADSSFNTALVQGGLQSATGVYLFSLVPQGAE
jgi:hypothetical protein